MTAKPWYHKGLMFQCAGCGNCCTGAPGFVWVNKAEIEAIAAAMGFDIEEFTRRHVRQVGIRKSLTELSNGDCVFFDDHNRRCRIYHVRPRQCRTWPFWASNLRTRQSWDTMCHDCPGGNHGPLVPVREIRAKLSELRV